MVEAAIGISVFLLVIFGIIELGRFMYIKQRAKHAMLAAAAQAGYLQNSFEAKDAEAIIECVRSVGAQFGFDLSAHEVSVCRLTLQGCKPGGNVLPGQQFKISTSIPYRLGWPLAAFVVSQLEISAVGRLEAS
jgi:hypothetical protein